jgi:ribonuclease VapC
VIIDTSAIVAILKEEPEAHDLLEALHSSPSLTMSAATYVECGIVLDGRGDAVLSRRLDELLDELDVTIAAVTPQLAQVARAAHRDFGRGSGHPAGLNFGDVFAYALAVETGEPLLFRGDDFGHTDVHPVRAR